jgi:hypothetical protein
VITGSIVGLDDQPVSGACVTAVGRAGSLTVAAAPGGTFRLAGLTAGSYALEYRGCAAAGRYLPTWSGGASAQSTAKRYQVGVGQTRHVPVTMLRPANPAAAMAAEQSSFQRTLASFQRTLAADSRNLNGAAAAGTGQISGTVTGNGEPLSRICVEVEPVYRGRVYGAKTGANGSYTVRHVAPGTYHVIFAPFYGCASRANWLQQVYKNDNDFDAAFGKGTAVHVSAGHNTTGIDAQLRLGGQIAGTVTNTSGAKVGGICVGAQGKIGPNEYQFSTAKTSSTGGYQLHALFPGRYTVQFSRGCGARGNYAPVTHPAVTVGLGQDRTVSQVLPVGATISGEVTLTSSSGTPIEGICVFAEPVHGTASAFGSASTNASGDYRMIGLAGGSYQLYFSPGCRNDGNYTSASLTVHTTAGEPTTGANAVLQVGGEISGTVTDTHGSPVAHMCIELAATGNYTALVPYRTAADGTYVIDQLSAGTYQVGFVSGCGNSASYAPNWYDNQSSENTATPITIALGATFTANAVLQPGATITGRVTSASGRPLSRVCVEAVIPSGFDYLGVFRATTQTRDGTYTLSGLAPGNYLINFGCGYGGRYPDQWFPDAPDAGLAEAVSAGPGTTAGIDAVLPATGVITGVVTSRAGHPLEDVCVSAVNIKGAPPALRGPGLIGPIGSIGTAGLIGLTSANGTYKMLGLAAGRYHVSFGSCFVRDRYAQQWYRDSSSVAAATAVTVRAGTTTAGIDGRLVPGGTISGHVLTASGKSLGDICVSAADSAGDSGYAVTDTAGTYTIPALGAGSYTVVISPCASRNLVTVVAHSTVKASRVTTVDATMHSGGSIAGVVTMGSTTVSDACVEVYSAGSAEPVGFGFTSLDGSYQITGLAAGSYQVYFGDPQCEVVTPGLAPQWYNGTATGTSAQATAASVAVTGGATTPSIDAALQPDGEITGTVSGPSATPLAGACVTAVPLSAGVSAPVVAVTSATGYALAELLPGQYKVRFSAGCGATGYATQWWKDAASRSAATVITVGASQTVTDISATLSKS